MKNILVALLLIVASQMLVAVSQDINPELNGPNDCGVRKSVIEKIFSLSDSEEDIRCGINLKPEKNKVVESNIREKVPNPTICFFGDCGAEDNNKLKSQIIKE